MIIHIAGAPGTRKSTIALVIKDAIEYHSYVSQQSFGPTAGTYEIHTYENWSGKSAEEKKLERQAIKEKNFVLIAVENI